MHNILRPLAESFERTGNVEKDMQNFLTVHNYPNIAAHSIEVGYEARRLAHRFGEDEAAAGIAGFLHDISVVFPNQDRVRVAEELGLEVLPEEEVFPLIIHQKISKVMAKEIFYIDDDNILDAIACHTTLKANATVLDRILFVADKIKWDQKGTPPYISHLTEQLEYSLEHAAFAYIDYLWQRRDTLKVVHPWLANAHAELKETLKQ